MEMHEIDKEQLDSLVSVLAHMRLRPGMYFSNTVPAIQNYLHGFQTACTLLGFDIWKDEQEIWAERGWKISALHPINQMRDKGMSDDEIAAEVFAMLILHLRRKYNISDESVLKVHKHIRDLTEKSHLDAGNSDENNIHKKHSEFSERHHKQIEQTTAAMDTLEQDIRGSSKQP
jgi:hypothetical protein